MARPGRPALLLLVPLLAMVAALALLATPVQATGVSCYNTRWTAYNDWDSSQNARAVYVNSFFAGMEGYHDDDKEDRKYSLMERRCTPLYGASISFTAATSTWGPNSWDGSVNANPGGNYLLRAMSSYHDDDKEDRKFTFEWGADVHVTLSSCSWTTVNSYDGSMDFSCGTNRGIRGLSSVHDDDKEDRVWQIECCTLNHHEDCPLVPYVDPLSASTVRDDGCNNRNCVNTYRCRDGYFNSAANAAANYAGNMDFSYTCTSEGWRQQGEKCQTYCEWFPTNSCIDAGECYRPGQMRSRGQADFHGLSCYQCDPSEKPTPDWDSPVDMKLLVGNTCNDQDDCTMDDLCQTPPGKQGGCYGVPFTCDECHTCNGASCDILDGYCQLGNPFKCVVQDDQLEGNQCFSCQPPKSVDVYSFRTNEDCNDNDLCTINDACDASENGCTGTRVTPLEPCQVCNGGPAHFGGTEDGLSLATSYDPHKNSYCVKDGQCGCNIEDTCHVHEDLNPDNECQYCDVWLFSDQWAPTVEKPCDDDLLCTYTDTCVGGTCLGTIYTCPEPQICQKYPDAFPEGCTGEALPDQRCAYDLLDQSTICRPEINACRPNIACTGSLATCPPDNLFDIYPVITLGTVWDSLEFGDDDISYQTDRTQLWVRTTGWETPCGALRINVGYHIAPIFKGPCSVNAAGSTMKEHEAREDTATTPVDANVLFEDADLVDGTIYVAVVQALNIYGDEDVMCSSGVLVDGSPPEAGTVLDVDPRIATFEDVDYLNIKSVQAQWMDIVDPHSGIKGYEVGLRDDQGAMVVDFIDKGTEQTHDFTDVAALTSGVTYYIVVRTTNMADLNSESLSDGFRFDNVDPVASAASVHDGLPASMDFTNEVGEIDFTGDHVFARLWWQGFTDADSAIDHYDWAVGLTNPVTSGFVTVPATQTQVVAATPLVSGQLYYATVFAVDKAGNKVSLTSDGVKVDGTPPVTTDGARVRDTGTQYETGAPADEIDYSPLDNVLSAEWSGFYDLETQIHHYEVAVGTQQFSGYEGIDLMTNIVEYSTTGDNPPVAEVALSSLALTSGTKYFLTVKAVNWAGLGSTVSADGIVIDTTPPDVAAAKVLDIDVNLPPLSGDADYHHSTTIAATWEDYQDHESFIDRYNVKIEASLNGASRTLLDWHNVGIVGSFSADYPDLVTGELVVVTIRAYNKAGLASEVSSDGVVVDFTPPVGGTVLDGPPAADTDAEMTVSVLHHHDRYQTPSSQRIDLQFQTSGRHMWATFSGYSEDESPIVFYDWAIGSTADPDANYDPALGPFNVLSFTPIGDETSDSAGADALPLQTGVHYCAYIRAWNAAGLSTIVRSNCVLVDRTAPVAGDVLDMLATGSAPLSGAAAAGLDVNFQAINNAAHASWTAAADTESGVEFYEWAVGSSAGASDLRAFERVGLLQEAEGATAATIPDGTHVHLTVRAFNFAGGSTDYSSDGFIVDASPPAIGQVWFGSPLIEGQITHQRSTSELAAHWKGFRDIHSDVVSYVYHIGTAADGSNSDVVAPTNVARFTHFIQLGELSLSHGTSYYITLTVTNFAGLVTTFTSSPLTVDTTAPTAPSSITCVLESGSRVSSTWVAAVDSEGPIASYSWGVGTSIGAAQASMFHDVGTATSAVVDNLELVPGHTYFCTVQAFSAARGIVSGATSAGVLFDNTPPVLAAAMLDGAEGPDVQYQTSTTSLAARWDTGERGWRDFDSGLSGFEVAVGVEGDLESLVSFQTVGMATSTSLAALTLQHGTRYLVSVRATNAVGGTAVGSTDGVMVDTTGPIGAVILDGPTAGEDIQFQAYDDSISASWSGLEDPESGVLRIEWAIGSAPGADNVQAYTYIGDGPVTSVRADGLELDSSTTYYVSLRAWNRAGLMSEFSSDGVAVDATGPEGGTVIITRTASDTEHTPWQSSTDTMYASWSGFVDDGSGVAGYAWCIGSVELEFNALSCTDVGTDTAAVSTDLELLHGSSYKVWVRAVNVAGSFSFTASEPVIVDATGPVPSGGVRDGAAGSSLQFQTQGASLSMNWDSFSDPESPLLYYEVGFGSSPDSDDLVAFAYHGLDLEATVDGLDIASGTKVYAVVKAVNSIGHFTLLSSDGVMVDLDGPIASGGIVDGDVVGVDLAVTADDSQACAAFQGFTDPESGLEGFEWALGTTAGAEDILPFESVNTDHVAGPAALVLSQVACSSDVALPQGATVYATVRAWNAAGLSSTFSSDGVLVDTTAPEAVGSALDGDAGDDAVYSNDASSLSARWGFDEPESSLASIQIAVGTKPLGEQVRAFGPVPGLAPDAGAVTLTGLSLAHEAKYYISIRVTNAAGLVATQTTNGVTLDLTGPVASTRLCHAKSSTGKPGATSQVERICDHEITAQLSQSIMYAVFGSFRDATSDVVSVEVGVGSTASTDDVSAFSPLPAGNAIVPQGAARSPNSGTIIGRVTTELVLGGLSLSHGQSYHMLLRATNGAGLSTIVASSAIIVDTSAPPALDFVNDGIVQVVAEDGSADAQFQDRVDTIGASWAVPSDPESGIGSVEIAFGSQAVDTAAQSDIVDWIDVTGLRYVTLLHGSNSQPVAVRGNGGLADNQGASAAIQVQLPISAGNRVYAAVRVTNSVGLTTISRSDGLVLDSSAPVAGTVLDGAEPGVDAAYTASATDFAATWSGFADPESDIVDYSLSVGTSAGGSQLQRSTSLGAAADSATVTLPPVAQGQAVFMTVCGTSGAGAIACDTTDGVHVDLTAPTPGVVSAFLDTRPEAALAADAASVLAGDGPRAYVGSDSSVTVEFVGFGETQGGLAAVEVGISSDGATADVAGFAALAAEDFDATGSAVSSTTIDGLSLEQDGEYVALVRVTNGAGLSTTVASNVFVVDATPPVAGEVADGSSLGSDTQCGFSTTLFAASWDAFADATSGITSFSLGLGTTPGSDDVVAFTTVAPTLRHHVFPLPSPRTVGEQLFVTVRATNGAGMQTERSSDGVIIVCDAATDAGCDAEAGICLL